MSSRKSEPLAVPAAEAARLCGVSRAKRERPRSGRKRSSARNGIHKATIQRYLQSLGFTWTPTMQIGSGCKVHLRAAELPKGRLIVSISKHLTAVINGAIHDTHDCSRNGTRCVYGYWSVPVEDCADS